MRKLEVAKIIRLGLLPINWQRCKQCCGSASRWCGSRCRCGSWILFHFVNVRIRILLVTLLRILILPFTLMLIRILASKYRIKTLKKCSNELIKHTFWLVICKLMRIRIQLVTLMRIQILPFKLMRIHWLKAGRGGGGKESVVYDKGGALYSYTQSGTVYCLYNKPAIS